MPKKIVDRSISALSEYYNGQSGEKMHSKILTVSVTSTTVSGAMALEVTWMFLAKIAEPAPHIHLPNPVSAIGFVYGATSAIGFLLYSVIQ
jgi:hypothetical protein